MKATNPMPRIPFAIGIIIGLALGIMLCRGKQASKQAKEDAFDQEMDKRNAKLRQDIDDIKYDRKKGRLSRWQS